MSIKTAKIIRIILLVIACHAAFYGVISSQNAAKKAATSLSKIEVQVVNLKRSHSNELKYIDLTFRLTNKTKVEWGYLEVKTYVYDRNGKLLGTLTSKFGRSYGTSDFYLFAKESLTRDASIKENSFNSSEFFLSLYNTNFTDLRFEPEVTYGIYYN